MLEEMIIRYCSPTLAGIKTGNLFTYFYESKSMMIDEMRRLNKQVASKGLCIVSLRFFKGRALIYVFRSSSLKDDLSKPEVCYMLESLGYCYKGIYCCIAQLISRLKGQLEFPHEIGLFLGYPLDDVRGFIDNKGHDYKYLGCWKVYSDEVACKILFDKYKKCTEAFLRCLAEGMTIEELMVNN